MLGTEVLFSFFEVLDSESVKVRKVNYVIFLSISQMSMLVQ